MAAITSENEICNMALSHLGNTGTVSDIRQPTNDKEITCALWYDIARQYTLKLMMPNFALARRYVSQRSEAPPFGYAYAYEYPIDAMKLLGVGDIDEKDLRYTVEGRDLLLDEDYSEDGGLPLRFIIDITDVTKYSPDFVILFSWVLAGYISMPITQDQAKRADIINLIPSKVLESSGLNAQENPPIRKSDSKFKRARYNTRVQRNNEKR